MYSAKVTFGNIGIRRSLGKDSRAICETVYYGRVELAQHKSQSFFKLIVDDHMLVRAKEAMWQIVKALDLRVEIFPFAAKDVELAGLWC